ncbi:MAG: ABC transporter permease subunit, partial [Oceanospirillum sp.]|nr:ABC transporter permease subunit [Oceanospirillum sp.]
MFEYNFHWRPVLKSLPDLLQAGLLTLEVAVLSMVIGITIGLCLALMRMKLNGPLKWFAVSWIEMARNTPVLFQLFFFGFGLGAMGVNLP